MARRACRRAGALARRKVLCASRRLRRVLDEFDDLAFGDATNLIQMQAALAFGFFGIFGRAEKSVSDHRDCRRWPLHRNGN